MKIVIKHDIKGRVRVHMLQSKMTFKQADTLQYYLESLPFVINAKVYERTSDAVIFYEDGNRKQVLRALLGFEYDKVSVPEVVFENSNRELNAKYWEKLVMKVTMRAGRKLIPAPIRTARVLFKATGYIGRGFGYLRRGRIEVPVLDATAIGVSIARNDLKTAGSVMFLLEIGALLEEWTHKKSVDDLAKSMSFHTNKVWQLIDGQEYLVSAGEIKQNDIVVVRMGTVIPFDGETVSGEAMVNESSLTGESLPVRKSQGNIVYAGTVVEEGEVTIKVMATNGNSKYEQIVTMIEETEKMKSALESKAEHLADRLVPYTFLGSIATAIFTRNITKAISVLMVDFSCALKLSMPVAVLSAIRELNNRNIMVKGGKFLEAIASADTVVFDKTGTLTKAQPTVVEVVSFCEKTPDEMLRIAACLEEHFPHSMAKAVVEAAKEKKLEHEEMHSKVEYIVAHGISTTVEGKKVIIGSRHFVFEDEKCIVPEDKMDVYNELKAWQSHLYLAVEGVLAAVICIDDPLRAEAMYIVAAMKNAGIEKVVMMTGDSKRTATAIAQKIGVDEFYYEVLPEDKAGYISKERQKGRTVIMVGDGINDSPALSAADVGIAISDGSELARQIADVTISGESLLEIVTLKRTSIELMKRIKNNYRVIVGVNSGLIALGVAGVIQPTTSAMLHNSSTLAVGLRSTNKLLKE